MSFALLLYVWLLVLVYFTSTESPGTIDTPGEGLVILCWSAPGCYVVTMSLYKSFYNLPQHLSALLEKRVRSEKIAWHPITKDCVGRRLFRG